MPNRRLSMRKIKEVLRLRYQESLTHRQIATSLNISASTVHDYVGLAKIHGLSWSSMDGMSEEALYQLLYKPVTSKSRERMQPDWEKVHQELRKKGVTLMLLWKEYRDVYQEGIGYTQFCHYYQQFVKSISPVMRQIHKGGEKCYVDYAGVTIPWLDVESGEIKEAQVFVGCLPASNYTYVEALGSQSIPDWLQAHENMFEFFGGVSRIVVPDNLKAAVTRAHYYDPDINRTYQDFAIHYGVAVVPARVRAPRDKANVETAVKCVEYFLAKLRHHTFTSLAEINEALHQELREFNQKPFQKLSGSRLSLFEQIDKPALRPLPAARYELSVWHKARVNIDYHVPYEHHHYSVPHHFIHQVLDLRITAKTVECFHEHQRVAVHKRAFTPHRYSTQETHMPRHHQEYAQWTPQRMLNWARKIGEHTQHYLEQLIQSRAFPEQAYRACLGILRLTKRYGESRLERACQRGSQLGIFNFRTIDTMLKNHLENEPLTKDDTSLPQSTHANVRGAHYYQ